MKINIEVQHVCTHTPRGIPVYIINLTRKLLERKKYEYQLTLFDKNKEMGNRAFINKHFGEYNCPVFECNDESYSTLLNESNAYEHNSYNDYTSTNADIYHFPHIVTIPDKLHGKMIVTCHDLIPTVVPHFLKTWGGSPRAVAHWQLSMKRLNDMQPIIIADSFATKIDVCNYTSIPPEQVHVVLLAHDEKIHYPEVDEQVLKMFNIDNPYILYVGTVDDNRKGVVDIVLAFEMIAARYSDLKLVLAGEYANRDTLLHDKLQKSQVRERIILTNYITVEQKRALLSSAEVFLFPSEYEGFGLPVLEAMACGSPVITTNVSSLPEVGGEAVVYVSPKNPEQLAHEIERLLNSDELRNEYIKKGFEQAKKFSWDKTSKMTEDVYRFVKE